MNKHYEEEPELISSNWNENLNENFIGMKNYCDHITIIDMILSKDSRSSGYDLMKVLLR